LQTASLFVLDGLANATDFAFHFWMGRVLIPADFAVLQTLNSVVLVYVTVSGVFQPAVARFVSEARGADRPDLIPAIFQTFLRAALWLGLALSLMVFFFSNILAGWLNLPVWSLQVISILIFLSTVRPVALGVLQGQERFIPFGFSRLLTALGRLLTGAILVGYGLRLKGAVIAFPVGWLFGILAAFLPLGRSSWRTGEQVPGLVRRGAGLSAYALIAYLAFMSLTSLDLIWVNRSLSGDLAGAYASLVLLRRVIALLPGVAVTIMFPRIVAALVQGRLPDRLLAITAGIVLAASSALAVIYFYFGDQIILNIFGAAYQPASTLLGWMGLAMIGMSLSAIWLNYYLAEEPAIYVFFLIAAVGLEWTLLTLLPPSMENATLAFGITGWSLTVAGLFLYLFKFRPALVKRQEI
jgi:O-antigen/teichoic acid export membrane protein